MIYSLKAPLALYMALREAQVPPELAKRAVDALAADFLAVAAQQNAVENPPKKEAERLRSI
ncbi:hypothetical protein B1757_06880 [Acidithiobacillus marinus]|uniref:Uncharacterized protein n=1 Tax=Acidithiobacillus marinus TaxID=187490 RepID=A0A2I1DMC3_9PROT|nr:hypothetical protein [Acidithiobacillus marinus]PKY11029.1 hypothetical protein B1757_06880 [Acidithiobacillus marinus]